MPPAATASLACVLQFDTTSVFRLFTVRTRNKGLERKRRVLCQILPSSGMRYTPSVAMLRPQWQVYNASTGPCLVFLKIKKGVCVCVPVCVFASLQNCCVSRPPPGSTCTTLSLTQCPVREPVHKLHVRRNGQDVEEMEEDVHGHDCREVDEGVGTDAPHLVLFPPQLTDAHLWPRRKKKMPGLTPQEHGARMDRQRSSQGNTRDNRRGHLLTAWTTTTLPSTNAAAYFAPKTVASPSPKDQGV